MKLKNLQLKNYTRFDDIEIEFNSKVTRLVGVNGSGKTSILNAIWATLKGIADKGGKGQLIGDRYRFIGSGGVSTDLKVTLIDEKAASEIEVTNKITKSRNQISFKAPQNYELGNEWLSGLLSMAFMSAKSFCQLSGMQQAIELGIDTSTYDTTIQNEKETLKVLNRELKELGKPQPVTEAKHVDVYELINKKTKIERDNEAENAKFKAIHDAKIALESDKADKIEADTNKEICSELIDKIEEIAPEGEETDFSEELMTDLSDKLMEYAKTSATLDTSITIKKKELLELPPSKEEEDTSSISLKIQESEKTNLMADHYKEYSKKLEAIEGKEEKIATRKLAVKQAESNRLNYIKSFDFGFDGLTVGEKGELLLADGKGESRPIKEPYFSRAQLEIIVARLHTSINPEFKVRWLDDFDLLDDDNQIKIIDELLEADFQIITAEVGKTKEESDNNVILIKDCSIVENYDDEEQKKSLL